MLDETVSAIIADIYRAADHAARWDATMQRVGTRLGAKWLLTGRYDEAADNAALIGFHGDTSGRFAIGAEEYEAEQRQHDPISHFLASAGGGTYDTRALAPAVDYLDHPYVRWNADRFGSTFWRCSGARIAGGSIGMVVHRSADAGPGDDTAHALQTLFFSHILCAAEIAARPPLLDDAEPLLSVGANGCVARMNEAAKQVLAVRDGFLLVDGRLRARDCLVATRFDRLLGQVLTGERPRASIAVRREAASPLLVTLMRVEIGGAAALLQAGAVLVRIVARSAPPAPRADWAALFRLTPAESRLTMMLLEDRFALRDAATRLGVTYETARTQIASVMSKVDVRSQTQLVRLLSRLG